MKKDAEHDHASLFLLPFQNREHAFSDLCLCLVNNLRLCFYGLFPCRGLFSLCCLVSECCSLCFCCALLVDLLSLCQDVLCVSLYACCYIHYACLCAKDSCGAVGVNFLSVLACKNLNTCGTEQNTCCKNSRFLNI